MKEFRTETFYLGIPKNFIWLLRYFSIILFFCDRRGGRVAEGNGLLNRRRDKPLPRVRISPSPQNLSTYYNKL